MGENMSPEIAVGEEGGRADITSELFVLFTAHRVFELSVYSQIILLSAAEAAVLADPGPLSTVSPQVDLEPALLAEHFLTNLARIALGVTQVLVLVSQLIGGELLITELTVEPLLLLPGVVPQLVVLAPPDSFEWFLVVTAWKSTVKLFV